MSLNTAEEALKCTLNLGTKPTILVEVTASNACNKRCSYCFEHKDGMTKMSEKEQTRQLELLKNLCEEFDNQKFDRLKISFWGGEPMLNYNFVRDVIKETSKFDFVDWHIFSNGTLDGNFKSLVCDEEFSPKLKYGRLSVQISFDGEPHHSLKRGYLPTEFDKTLELLASNGILFNFKGTLAADSLHLMPQCWDSYYELFKRLDTKSSVYWCPAIDSTANLLDVDLRMWKKTLLDVAKREMHFIEDNGRPLLTWFKDKKRFCDVRFSTHMHSDGKFYLCHGAPYIEDNERRARFVTGTTSSVSSIMDVISSSSIDINAQSHRCTKCGATYCGTCHVNVVDANNVREDWLKCIAREDKGRCRLMKEFGKVNRILRLALASRGIFLRDK